jgi:hypothetical protein
MAEIRQAILKNQADLGFVIDAQYAQGTVLQGRQPASNPIGEDCVHWNGEDQPHGGPHTWSALNFELPLVSLHHAVNHSQPQTGAAALELGGEEGLQATPTRFFVHANSVVPHLDDELSLRGPVPI